MISGRSFKEKKSNSKMPGPWLSWTKTLACKADRNAVYDPSSNLQPQQSSKLKHVASTRSLSSSIISESYRSSCNCSFSNLKDVIHGNTRVMNKSSTTCSPRSKGDSDYMQDFSSKELNDLHQDPFWANSPLAKCDSNLGLSGRRESIGLETPGHGFAKSQGLRKFSGCHGCKMEHETMNSVITCRDPAGGCYKQVLYVCQRCGDRFNRKEAIEHHHTVKHAVSELSKGDSSRNIIEIIFRTSWLKKEISFGSIIRILKIQNSQKTISRFEDYRETVRSKAQNMPKKHVRCMADGNELLRFCPSTIACSLGSNGSSSLCNSYKCNVCRIIKSGFGAKKDSDKSCSSARKDADKAIYTTATSSSAHASLPPLSEDVTHAMLVCRVIAGRIYRGSDNLEEFFPPNGYDSISGESAASSSNLDDLYVFNPRALLACFVVIYKC